MNSWTNVPECEHMSLLPGILVSGDSSSVTAMPQPLLLSNLYLGGWAEQHFLLGLCAFFQ
jgi:hypothetical protein